MYQGGYKKCTKCGELKPIRNFSKRAQIKKDGSSMYLSHCKICRLDSSKKKECPTCDKMISKSSRYCSSCAALNRTNDFNNIQKNKTRHKGTVDEKWLVRGLVQSTASGFTSFNQ